MSRNTIRFILVLGVLSITGIIAVQAYWVKRAFDIQNQQFRQTVMVALRNVANQISKAYKLSVIENPVSEYSSDYYVVNLRTPLNEAVLEHYLKEEFKRNNLKTDFEYGIYDCDTDKIVYGAFVNANYESDPNNPVVLPKTDQFLNYFGVKFPGRKGYLVSKLDFWIISSGITLLVTAFFGYSMFVILKQKRLSEVQRDFINNMTHEFQTPISTIRVATDVLGQQKILEQPDRLRKYVNIIRQENNRLKNQVEAVLATARIGKGNIELDLRLQEMHELITEVTEGVRAELEDGLTLHLKAEKTTVNVDRMHTMNVVRNLLDNAVKYSSKPPRISINTRNEGNKLIVEVVDKGIGIPKEHQGKIFDRFYRVPTGNVHNVKGFGLGLSYVKEIVKHHKWTIEVDSEFKAGTTFRICIPQNS